MCEDNDKIMEEIAEKLKSEFPNMKNEELKIKLQQAFESLPEPDFDEEDINDE